MGFWLMGCGQEDEENVFLDEKMEARSLQTRSYSLDWSFSHKPNAVHSTQSS